MPRPLKIDRPKRVEVQIPESIFAKTQVELYSELEGKVPFGAVSGLVTELLREWLKSRGVAV